MMFNCRMQVSGDTEIARKITLEEIGSIPMYGTKSQRVWGAEALLVDALKVRSVVRVLPALRTMLCGIKLNYGKVTALVCKTNLL